MAAQIFEEITACALKRDIVFSTSASDGSGMVPISQTLRVASKILSEGVAKVFTSASEAFRGRAEKDIEKQVRARLLPMQAATCAR